MMEQQQLLNKIFEIGFAIDDIILYLDTHPCDANAFQYYQEMQQLYHSLRETYAQNYGPLTIHEVISNGCSCNNEKQKFWSWTNTPMPWEGGC